MLFDYRLPRCCRFSFYISCTGPKISHFSKALACFDRIWCIKTTIWTLGISRLIIVSRPFQWTEILRKCKYVCVHIYTYTHTYIAHTPCIYLNTRYFMSSYWNFSIKFRTQSFKFFSILYFLSFFFRENPTSPESQRLIVSPNYSFVLFNLCQSLSYTHRAPE